MKRLVVCFLVLSVILTFVPVFAAPTEYAVKGIEDGERIPVSTRVSSLTRTISVVDASATARTVTAATNLAKAEFYIDNVLAATVTDNPCQWELPLTDLNPHTLTVVTTDADNETQSFGPYTYTAFYMIDGASSFTEYFEGTEGDSVVFTDASRVSTFNSTENPVYATVNGGTGTAMQLTMASGKNTNIQTSSSIFVPEQGVTTVDMDIYCTSASSSYKIYLRMRNSGGYYMNETNKLEILENLQMNEIAKEAWHHISFVFDSTRKRYCAFIDGYEFMRANMGRAPGRNVYFQFTTQSYTSGYFYLDNLEIMSKTVSTDDALVLTDEGASASAVVINNSNAAKSFDLYRAEYGIDNKLVDISAASADLGAKGIWHNTVSTVPATGSKIGIYLWDRDLTPLADPIEK